MDMFFQLIYRCFLFYHNNPWSAALQTSDFTDIFPEFDNSLWCLSHFSFCSITFLTLYNVFTDHGFNPIYYNYGITALGRAGKTHRNKILRLLKRAFSLMFFCDYKTQAIPLFISLILLLQVRFHLNTWRLK